jgi:predicted peptidase
MGHIENGPQSGAINSVMCLCPALRSSVPQDGWPLLLFLHGRGEAADQYPEPMVGSAMQVLVWSHYNVKNQVHPTLDELVAPQMRHQAVTYQRNHGATGRACYQRADVYDRLLSHP